MELEVFLLASKRDVTLRGMKVKEVNQLTNRQAMSSGAAMEAILKDCLVTPGVDLDDALQADRNCVFFGIRRATFGNEYDFKVKCPACSEPADYEVDLAKLDVNEGNPAMISEALADPKATFPFVLPESGSTVRWRFLRGRDNKKIIEMQKKKSDRLASESLLLRVVEVDGLREAGIPLKRWAEELDAGDLQALTEYIDSCTPGYDDKIHVYCQNGLCGARIDMTMPIDAESFFKRSSKTKRA